MLQIVFTYRRVSSPTPHVNNIFNQRGGSASTLLKKYDTHTKCYSQYLTISCYMKFN